MTRRTWHPGQGYHCPFETLLQAGLLGLGLLDALRAADPAGPGLDGQDLNLDLVPNLRQGSALRPSLLPSPLPTPAGYGAVEVNE